MGPIGNSPFSLALLKDLKESEGSLKTETIRDSSVRSINLSIKE